MIVQQTVSLDNLFRIPISGAGSSQGPRALKFSLLSLDPHRSAA